MSEGGNFRSEAAELKSLIGEVNQMQTTLHSRINKLNATVDAIEGGWKGSAHGAYDRLQREANEYARKLHRRLQFMEEALESSRSGFSANEVNQMENFNKVAGSSPISDFTGRA
ncbi:hypothetical protein N566_26110 [Streptomycetaceae bacterium MP113-05]|nr:hypothetical protein N566_26110 [Streptomycetaceae bacterium MP113-05]